MSRRNNRKSSHKTPPSQRNGNGHERTYLFTEPPPPPPLTDCSRVWIAGGPGGPPPEAEADATARTGFGSRGNSLKAGLRSRLLFPDAMLQAIDERDRAFAAQLGPVTILDKWLVRQMARGSVQSDLAGDNNRSRDVPARQSRGPRRNGLGSGFGCSTSPHVAGRCSTSPHVAGRRACRFPGSDTKNSGGGPGRDEGGIPPPGRGVLPRPGAGRRGDAPLGRALGRARAPLSLSEISEPLASNLSAQAPVRARRTVFCGFSRSYEARRIVWMVPADRPRVGCRFCGTEGCPWPPRGRRGIAATCARLLPIPPVSRRGRPWCERNRPASAVSAPPTQPMGDSVAGEMKEWLDFPIPRMISIDEGDL